mmetsp:Transcript_20781/g.67945  ORF Transcript_20781/g.67945 Transcript_20781/m.67945 type:complete len:264 (-) Transcript_20781:23-814(-)
MRRFLFGANPAWAFGGATIPETGPGGSRGETVLLHETTPGGLWFWLSVAVGLGSDGQLYAMLKKDVPGLLVEIALQFGAAFSAGIGAIRSRAKARSNSRVVVVPLEDSKATSVTNSPRAMPFAEAAVSATPGAIVLPLLRRSEVGVTKVARRRGDDAAGAGAELGSLCVDRVQLASLRQSDTVVVLAEDTHADVAGALRVLAAADIPAQPLVVFRDMKVAYQCSTQSLLSPKMRAWRVFQRREHARPGARRATRRARRETSHR